MITIEPLTGYGQIGEGDVLLLKRANEYVAPVEVKRVMFSGTEQEEIIISKSKNLYFIVSLFLAGKSWVKECSLLRNGRMYSVSNSRRDITCYHEDER